MKRALPLRTETDKSADIRRKEGEGLVDDVIRKYGDMLDMPHYRSKNHPAMSVEDRAAQFSPFAALTGHEEALEETARYTDKRAELDENAKTMLNEKLQIVNELRPTASIVHFKRDELKQGGAYVTTTGEVKRIDGDNRTVIMKDGNVIAIDDIYDIFGSFLKE